MNYFKKIVKDYAWFFIFPALLAIALIFLGISYQKAIQYADLILIGGGLVILLIFYILKTKKI